MFLGYNSFMNISDEFDTITAIATPLGTGGVGVIRISGDKSFEIIDKINSLVNFSFYGVIIFNQLFVHANKFP